MSADTRSAGGSPVWPDERSDLLAFLPMIHFVWHDGVLTPAELDAFRGVVESQEWLDEDGRNILRSWLRPDDPPASASVADLRLRVRDIWPADGEPPDTLSGLGLELIRSSGLTSGPWSLAGAPEALARVEERLGVIGHEAVRELLGLPSRVDPCLPADAALDVRPLTAHLNSTHRDVRARVMELLATPELALPAGLSQAEYREWVLGVVRMLAAEGLGSLGYPEDYGGRDDLGASIAAFETLAYGDLSVLIKFGVQFGLWGGSVLQLGTERHHRAYLEGIGTLDLPGCFAMTETGHGSNVRDLQTVARYEADQQEFVVHTPCLDARKDWIGNAALHGRMATVFAQLEVGGTEHGVHAFVVPIRDDEGATLPGITITDRGAKVGLNGVDNGTIGFHRVRVPRENLLNRFGEVTPDGTYSSPITSPGRRFFTMLSTLVGGRISIAAASVSAAKTALTIAVKYGDSRRQFGPANSPEVPLLEYTVHRLLLLPRLATTYGLHFAVQEVIERYAAQTTKSAETRKSADATKSTETTKSADAARTLEVDAAGLKAYASIHAMRVIQSCREACGGQGYLAANRFGTLRADVDVFTTFEGANAVLLQLVAKGLLSDYREEMGDLKLWGVVRYLADRAGTRVTEMNPIVTKSTDEAHLRDPEFHAAALRYREERLLGSLARRLKALIDDGATSFEAVNGTQDHMVKLAMAHVEHTILKSFRDGAAGAPDSETTGILSSLATLYALETIDSDKSWYLESGYMDASKTRAIRGLVNQLCTEIRSQAVCLVDGFGIPEGVLSAPAAT